MIDSGERNVLLSHIEYRRTRKEGLDLTNHTLLMRQPEEATDDETNQINEEVWIPVPAAKYLKYRANGWREAGSIEELPVSWREQAGDRDPFAPDKRAADGRAADKPEKGSE
jgi:hypothetical protein